MARGKQRGPRAHQPTGKSASGDALDRESEHLARLEEAGLFRLGPVTDLAGVGPARAEKLARLGIHDLRDLLLFMPSSLDEWPAAVDIARIDRESRESQRVAGRVARTRFRRGRGRRSLVTVVIEDDTGTLEALFFNQAWLRERFAVGESIEVRGKLSGPQKAALIVERLGTPERPLPPAGALVPGYPTTEGLGQGLLRELTRASVREWAAALEDPLGRERLERHGLVPLSAAVRELHAPASRAGFERARRRVALEPLLHLQARLSARRALDDAGRAQRLTIDAPTRARLLALHPFELTAGQRAAIAAIETDAARSRPMRRLLIGDVGSGKTAVGLHAALLAIENGAQAAFLAPTELLAEQHAAGLSEQLDSLGVRHALLTGSLPRAEAKRVRAELAAGRVDLVFGTHALFSEDVRYASLALAVVDEQHRFGVGQRQRLLDKGRDVHALFLSATPIPRSLAQTIYADLDLTTLSERPPGRAAIRTHWLRGGARRGLGRLLGERLAVGERVYWVCPRIGDKQDEACEVKLASVEERFASLLRSSLGGHALGLVHGRLAPEQRADVLERFRRGAIQLLVATTVVEVGVDVPEATVMVIENAERLGLAQLHQLRGRVGRGSRQSYCYLLAAPETTPVVEDSGAGQADETGQARAAQRLELLEATDDGFAIAEADLAQRGMGDLLGLRQSGVNAEGLGDLRAALELCEIARDLIAADPHTVARYLAGAPADFLAS